jgi:cysteine-rich repeat protein
LSGGVCNDICGDGLLYTLPCDDGNTINGDGCSSTCSVETDYTCVGGTTTTPSLCSFSGTIAIKIISFIKDPSQNKVYVVSTISPSLQEFSVLDFNQALLPDFAIVSTSTAYDPATGNISMTFTYN